MYIVTTAQMQAAEKNADAHGLSYEQMMENAGRAVAEAIESQFDVIGAQVLILVGPGNNGGDGLVVARYLWQAGASVAVYVWKRANLETDPNWQQLKDTGVAIISSDEENSQLRLTQLLERTAVIVDALLGTGVSRPIGGTLAVLLAQVKQVMTSRRALVEGTLVTPARPDFESAVGPVMVAVDLPSGLHSDTGIADSYTLTADLTVTLATVKQGHILLHGPNVIGQLVVGDIKIAPEHYPAEVALEMATGSKVARLLPTRPPVSHKGSFGRVMLVAGSTQYTGAAALTAQAAARSGTGWVMVACPQPIYPILAGLLPEATYLPVAEAQGGIAESAVSTILSQLDRVTAMLIGPGLGQAEGTLNAVTGLLTAYHADKESINTPLIVDADGLNILAQQPDWWTILPPHTILTPHLGEMGRLTGDSIKSIKSNRLTVATEMAKKWGVVLLLKGAYTIVAEPEGRTMVLPFANPALAKAGSGDVLAGLIAGLRAQGLPAFESAVTGAYIHGLAGELARENLGAMAVTAGDLIGFLPLALSELNPHG
ncbi:NAD(P)H-hydrate dehydratase [Anaerolineales bacterium HSG25]|nr:NAD(P)H-hydrate dehydratase [Anaerolineales bacterium HSG25]